MFHRILLSVFAALLIVALSTPAMASKKFETRGTVESIDSNAKTFVVKDHENKIHAFKIGERTEMEIEHRADKKDEHATIKDLKTGDSVKVKAYKGESPYTARDIEIYR